MNAALSKFTEAVPMKTARVVEIREEESGAEWDAYVRGAEGAAAYHAYAWRKLIRDVFGHESHYFAAHDPAGKIVGVLPLVRLRSPLFGDFMVSLPFFNYGGVLADSPAVVATLSASAAECAKGLGVSHVELRHTADLCPQWPSRTDKVTMLLPLPESAALLNKQLDAKVRSQIKRPLREGAVASHGGLELLDDYYAVFSRNMRDLGTPVYPKRFFERILQAFPQAARIHVVRLGGEPVAAGFVIGAGDTLEIPWASSLRSANAVGVNMLLYWSVLERACEAGYRQFDFGRSTRDSGTFRFKKQWGAQPKQLTWHYWLRNGGQPPQINPANPKYQLAVKVWQKLPLPVANFLGPLIVKHLP
jgi:FemAB-related protein (PEP-CTERM system-associated)